MNQPIAMNTTRKHVVWLDVVRLVAIGSHVHRSLLP